MRGGSGRAWEGAGDLSGICRAAAGSAAGASELCWAVAEGAVDASAEPEVSLWDVAPLQVLVEEAGGRFTDLAGADRPDGGSVVCSNGLLHDPVLRGLGGA